MKYQSNIIVFLMILSFVSCQQKYEYLLLKRGKRFVNSSVVLLPNHTYMESYVMREPTVGKWCAKHDTIFLTSDFSEELYPMPSLYKSKSNINELKIIYLNCKNPFSMNSISLKLRGTDFDTILTPDFFGEYRIPRIITDSVTHLALNYKTTNLDINSDYQRVMISDTIIIHIDYPLESLYFFRKNDPFVIKGDSLINVRK